MVLVTPSRPGRARGRLARWLAIPALALVPAVLPLAHSTTGVLAAPTGGGNGSFPAAGAVAAPVKPLAQPVGPVTVTDCTTAGYNQYLPAANPPDIGLGGALAHGNAITFACNATLSGAGPYTIVPPGAADGQGAVVGINITTGSVSIDGSDGGAFDVTIDGGGAEVVFEVATGASLSLANLSVAHGNGTVRAGAAQVAGGALTVANSTFHDNAGSFGGAIDGGGFIYPCGASITVTGSTFLNNTSGGNGGAVESCAPLDTIANSTFVGNTGNAGGAVNFFNLNNTLTVSLVNNTFSGNQATFKGGAIGAEKNSPTVVGTVLVANALLANNTAATPPAGCYTSAFPLTDGGGNLEYPSNSCGFSLAKGDSFGNPNLGPLANNGGPTQTMALLPGSAAIGLGLAATCLSAPVNDVDQRGVSRFVALRGMCDAGAYDTGGVLTSTGAVVAGGGARVGFAASESPTWAFGYLTYQGGSTAFVVRQPVALTRRETCTGSPCTAMLTLSGTVGSAYGPVVAIGDTAQVIITVQALAGPFVRTFTSIEVKVTTPGGAVVLDRVIAGPFLSPGTARIVSH